MHRYIAMVALAASHIALNCTQAEAGIVYRYSAGPKIEVIGVDAIVELEQAMTEPDSGCSQRIADLTIDEVMYQANSETIVGFRAKKPGTAQNSWYGAFSMDTNALYRGLSNAERRNVQMLVRKGAKVLVVYQVCGSGGFASVRDIWAKSSINKP